MIRAYYIVMLIVATMFAACGSGDTFIGGDNGKRVVANVDDKELLLRDILADMPEGLTGIDSATFVRMYTDNWVLNQLKLERAKQVLTTSQGDIDRLVEDYRQSLIMRQLDQYYVDKELDTDITERQISAHYRMHSSQFVLNHDKVRGVVVRVSDKFRNTSALSDALRNVSNEGMVELNAFAEKHSLQVTDLSGEWVTFSDFLSYLPTVRTRSYDNVLQKGKVQSMKSDDIVFYFTIVDVAKRGSVAPLECVEDDIRRMLYAERRSEIVKRYEMELKLEGVESGRVTVDDVTLMDAMSNRPKIGEQGVVVTEAKDVVREDDVAPKREPEQKRVYDKASQSEDKSGDEPATKSAEAKPAEEPVKSDAVEVGKPQSEQSAESGAGVAPEQAESVNK
ncbi:MAG: hypothetical protein UHS52_05825 [Alistipes sp.]|nr:hypothetical protein [Alistipes sp.]